MKIYKLDSIDSTNTYLKQNANLFEHGDLICAVDQTAGRGQRGNSWEAAPGLNITCSMLLRWTDYPANRQFAISQAVSLAIVRLLREQCGVECKIKWPNDIYYGDSKICGILIEHSLTGFTLDRTIVGIGININQPRFLSDAPNPISVRQITGSKYDIDHLTQKLQTLILEEITALTEGTTPQPRYMQALWRGVGDHPFHDVVTGRTYRGHVLAIEPTGHLTIAETTPTIDTAGAPSTNNSPLHRYAFKEVEWPI